MSSLCDVLLVLLFFFFKQKTAYEMRISDWSSDVCSSDLKRTGMVFIGENQGLPTDLHDVGMLGDQPKWIEAGGLHQAKGESLSQLGERFMYSVPVFICSRTHHLFCDMRWNDG